LPTTTQVVDVGHATELRFWTVVVATWPTSLDAPAGPAGIAGSIARVQPQRLATSAEVSEICS
jgi:hypothetical protein